MLTHEKRQVVFKVRPILEESGLELAVVALRLFPCACYFPCAKRSKVVASTSDSWIFHVIYQEMVNSGKFNSVSNFPVLYVRCHFFRKQYVEVPFTRFR